jgi:serine/threonine-protein kinase
MFVLAATFVGYFGLLLHSDLTRPEPTAFVFGVHDSQMFVRAVVRGSTAERDDLAVGDRVLSANAHPMHSRLDWLAVEMNLRVGEALRLDVARPGGSQTIVLPVNRAPRSYWLTTAGATLLSARGVQLATLALALVVAFRRPFDRSARIGAWALATLAVYSIVWPYQIAATWRALPAVLGLALWIPFVSSLAIAAVLFTFFATFPRPIVRTRWVWLLLWAPMVPILFLQLQFAWRVVSRPAQTAAFADWTPVSVAVTAAYTMGALAILAIGYRGLTDRTERRRVRMLVVGSAVGLLSALPIVIGYWWRSDVALGYSVFVSPLVAIGSILALALPLSFAYAILRHRLFDVSLIVRLGLQYALGRRVLVSIVPATLATFLADLWLHRESPFADILLARGWLYVALAALAVVARVRRNDWLDALDRRFFRERYNAQRLLRGIGDEVRTAASLDAVAARVVTQIENALHPEFVTLFFRHPHETFYRPAATAPAAAPVEPLESDSKAAGLLRWLQKPIEVPHDDRGWLVRQLPAEEMDWLRRTHIELLVPVQLGTGVTEALFAMGPKRSEEPYSAEDEDLLMAIGDSLARLLARAPTASPDREAFDECPHCGTCYDFGVVRCPSDGTALMVASSARLLGGRYRLDRRIGRGGMGTVYVALDTALDRPVAAKLLREDLVAPDAAERFQSEARLAAALAHPNVVTVHDIGVAGAGRAFFIMELLEGVTLRDELKRAKRLAPARALRILRGVSTAVDAAHRRQMIHRDLKPENVFLCRDTSSEIPKVLDFGLAKALEAGAGSVQTKSGLVAGTPPYMAPEHLAGDEPSPDWDLWALAVMAFEMVTGTLPMTGPTDPLLNLGDLPVAWRPLFARALSANPIERPTSAMEFSAELDRALIRDGLPT